MSWTSEQYYKHITIVNDNSTVISKYSLKLIDDPRVVIYDCHMFIVQATGACSSGGSFRSSPLGLAPDATPSNLRPKPML